MTEEWADIDGYEGIYQVSSLGNVRSLDRVISSGARRKGQLIKLQKGPKAKRKAGKDRDAYLQVTLAKNWKQKTFLIHRLVAAAFLPAVEGKDVVNHINGDKTDNRLENLEWCTYKENMEHASGTGLMSFGDDHHTAKLTASKARAIRSLHSEGRTYASLSREYGVSPKSIMNVVNNRTWTHA